MKYRKKPIVIEATQWLKNGDHPKDHDPIGDTNPSAITLEKYSEYLAFEGQVVRYYRNPDDDGQRECKHCNNIMHDHGWIDTLEGGHNVCSGDWIITGIKGEYYPVKNDIFLETYEKVGGELWEI